MAYRKELFYYKFPSNLFNDTDGDTLFLLLSQSNGNLIPSWLFYEDITQTLSGIPNENSTDCEILVIADDRRGGTASQTFKITLQTIITEEESYLALIIVCSLLGGFILIVMIVVCRKNLKCKRKTNGENSDSDSFEEDDDICIEDAKPKNPLAFQKQLEETAANDKYKNERYKFYGTQAQMPTHAKTKQKIMEDHIKHNI